MKNRYILCLILILSTLVFVFASCDSKTDTENGGNDITDDTVVTQDTSEPTYLESVPLPDYFEGESFNIGWANAYDINECAFQLEELDGDLINDAVHERNRAVEERLGITITTQRMCDWTETLNTLSISVMAGEEQYDAVCASTVFMYKSSVNGLLYNLTEIETLDLANDWWDEETIGMYSFGTDSVYFASGEINYVDDYAMHCIYFNKILCDQYNLEYPYQLVLDGDWTFNKFLEYSSNFGIDLDGNDQFDEKDLYGFVNNRGMINHFFGAAGEQLVNIGKDGSVTLNTGSRISGVVDFVFNLAYGGRNDVCVVEDKLGYDVGNTIFPNGNALFAGNFMVGAIAEFRMTMDNDFGVLPYPKYDETQKKYYGQFNTVYGTSYGVPVNYNSPEKAGWIFDVMGYYSPDIIHTAVIEKTIKGKSVRDEESIDMLELIFDGKQYELGSWGSSIYGGITEMIANKTNTFSSLLEKFASVTVSEFEIIKDYYNFG